MTRTTFAAAFALTAILGTSGFAFADTTSVYNPSAASAVPTLSAACKVPPCPTSVPIIVHPRPAANIAVGTTPTSPNPVGSFRWPWQKKKNVDRTKF